MSKIYFQYYIYKYHKPTIYNGFGHIKTYKNSRIFIQYETDNKAN